MHLSLFVFVVLFLWLICCCFFVLSYLGSFGIFLNQFYYFFRCLFIFSDSKEGCGFCGLGGGENLGGVGGGGS